MIQVVLMDGRKFINGHANFSNKAIDVILGFLEEALRDDEQSIIEISKWVNTNDGKQIPTKRIRHERRRIPEKHLDNRPDGLRAGNRKT